MLFIRISDLFIKRGIFVLVCLLIFNVIKLKAQARNCGTMIYFEEQKKNNPTLEKRIKDNEVKLQNWIKNNANKNLGSIISIPVVVHVVYNNSNENISDQQIQSQINILNEDFRRQNADAINTPSAFLSVAADTEIEFCLATEDPNGNTSTGITRTSTSQSSFSTNDGVKYSSSGGVDAWNPLEYLNIWVCDLSGGLLGYAQFPGGTVSSDGVVCDYAYFGNMGTATSPYDLGRTATHEVGHWLNLRHIWGDSNCGNDFCNDTPEHSGSNYGCPSYPSTSNCSGNGTSGDMFMNYMDYTDDACMNIFTQDQKNRMIASINNNRSGLLTSNGCSNADYGCTDQLAYNYSAVAIFNDGSCCYDAGCTNITAINYDASVCYDDGSCQQPILGCTNPSANNFDPTANTTVAFGGALDNTFGSGGYFNGDQHLVFDASKECVIKSATIDAESSSTILFELRNSNGVVIDDTTLNVIAGQQQVILNFEVPIGNDMQLGVAAGALQNVGLYRNDENAIYPYDIASAISITNSSAGLTGFPGYYYFYYNIEVEVVCESINNTVLGCTDLAADNYDPSATVDDGSCIFSVCANAPITGLYIDGIIDDRVNANYDNMNTYDANGNQICRVDQIRIQYRPVATSAWSSKNIASPTGYNTDGVCNSTQATMKPIRNLTLATEYEWKVKVWYCNGGNGGWVSGPNFTTADECPNVVNLTAYGANPTKATFDWDASNGVYEFTRIKMRVDSISNPTGSDWTLVGGFGVPYGTNTKNKNGLVAGETYKAQARTWCDPNGGAYNSLSWTQPVITWTQPVVRLEGGSAIANLDVYPNPSRDVFNISFTSETIQDLQVRVLNVVGEVIISENLDQFICEYTKKIDLTNNAKGIYFLEIETKDGVINKKLILQ
jgi:hypothetical protein